MPKCTHVDDTSMHVHLHNQTYKHVHSDFTPWFWKKLYSFMFWNRRNKMGWYWRDLTDYLRSFPQNGTNRISNKMKIFHGYFMSYWHKHIDPIKGRNEHIIGKFSLNTNLLSVDEKTNGNFNNFLKFICPPSPFQAFIDVRISMLIPYSIQ